MLAEACDFVDERNLGSYKSSRRLASQFSGLEVGDQHRNSAHHQRMEYLLKSRDCFTGRRPQDDAVRPVEVFDSASVGKEHRLAYQDAAQRLRFQRFFESRGRANTDW